MTKLRAPATIEEALVRIAAQVPGGFDSMAARLECSPSLVRAWSDPDRIERLPLVAAVALDLLFQESGGAGAPCHETYTLQLEIGHARRFADQVELARGAIDLISEAGEAGAALVAASLPGATRSDRERALKEAVDLDRVLKHVLPQLQQDQEAPP